MDAKEFVERYYVDRRNSNCYKWDVVESKFGSKDVIPLWVADADFKAPDSVTEALYKMISHGVFGYRFAGSDYELSLVQWEKEVHDCEIKKEWIRYIPGGDAGLYSFVGCFTEPGDAVMIQTPVYYPFADVVTDLHRRLICIPLKNTNGYYTMDYDDIEQKIKNEKVKAFILCSPHNPCGRVWKKEELHKLLKICKKYHVIVMADEVHQDLIMSGYRHTPLFVAGAETGLKDLIVMTAPSKTFNIAGLQNAMLIIPDPEKREKLHKFHVRPDLDEGTYMGYIAAAAAYKGGKEWLSGFLNTIEENFNYLRANFSKYVPEAVVSPLEGTYLAWVDLRKCIKAEDMKDVIAVQAKAGVEFGDKYAPECAGFIRVNLATSMDNVKKAVDSMCSAIKAYEMK